MNDFFLLVAVGVRLAATVFRHCRRRIQSLKIFPRPVAHALCQPQGQYRMALVLATILALLLGWPLFVFALAHASLACIGYR